MRYLDDDRPDQSIPIAISAAILIRWRSLAILSIALAATTARAAPTTPIWYECRYREYATETAEGRVVTERPGHAETDRFVFDPQTRTIQQYDEATQALAALSNLYRLDDTQIIAERKLYASDRYGDRLFVVIDRRTLHIQYRRTRTYSSGGKEVATRSGTCQVGTPQPLAESA